ncbi:MAG TPA: hypothetical protein VEF06_14515 [Bryobacteraceae bacterium]|nr:hypothetical protein [Bryobacteraceae bacterium]
MHSFLRPLVLLAAASAAWGQGPNLAAARPVVSQSEDGPPMQGGESFVPGEQVFFRYIVEGLNAKPADKIRLTGHIQAFDPKGVAISVPDEQVIATTLAQEDKEWKPKIRSQFLIPTIAPPGTYRIRYDVVDEQTKKKATGEATFSVRSHAVEPAKELVIRNLGFYRAQDEQTPLKVVAYRAGDVLFVRLDITGYKYGEQNAIDVSYDVEILGPGGKSLFSQPDAAVERSQAFYPQPWVPVEFNLNLQTTMTLGTYTLVITAHDGVGNQTATEKTEFRVE